MRSPWISSLPYSASGQLKPVLLADQQAEVAQRYGLDVHSSLESRVQETPASILKMFDELDTPKPTAYTLTKADKHKLSAAFAALPPLHRQILRERLRSVSFLNGMPNTALTSIVNPGEPFRLFDITIRSGVLRQNASEWLTEKERTCFNAAGSPLSISIEAGTRSAIDYVLLHEATHIVDVAVGITPPAIPGEQRGIGVQTSAFTNGTWSERLMPVPAYHDTLRERVRFRAGGEVLSIDAAAAVYTSLRKTPFVSLYASSNWYEDLAEYVAVYHWTERLKQPFRIVIRNDNKTVFLYEPMKSALVRRRVNQMPQFYTGTLNAV